MAGEVLQGRAGSLGGRLLRCSSGAVQRAVYGAVCRAGCSSLPCWVLLAPRSSTLCSTPAWPHSVLMRCYGSCPATDPLQVRKLFPSAKGLNLKWHSIVKIAQSLYREVSGSVLLSLLHWNAGVLVRPALCCAVLTWHCSILHPSRCRPAGAGRGPLPPRPTHARAQLLPGWLLHQAGLHRQVSVDVLGCCLGLYGCDINSSWLAPTPSRTTSKGQR